MAWWWPWASSDPKADAKEAKAIASFERKCKGIRTGLAGCRKANSANLAPCKNLEVSLITCLAEGVCKEQAAAHRRCYTSLYKTGGFEGVPNCDKYVDAMKECLKKKKMYPV